MAKNRGMQAKVMKMKRKGRFKMRSTAVVNGTGPKYKQYSANMAIMGNFHGNPKTIGQDDGFLDAMFPSANMTPHRRLEVIHRIAQMREQLPLERSVFYVPGKITSLRLFVKTPDNGDPPYYFFVEHMFRLSVVRKSITYRTRDAAMAAHGTKIRWKEVLNISEPDSPAGS